MELMMTTTGWNYGFIALWGLHILSVIAFFTGVLFFIIIAIKTFTPSQFKAWAIWLMVIGTIICLFTIAVIGRPWIGLWYWGNGMQGAQMMQMGQMMERMMEHDQGMTGSEHSDHEDMEKMMRMMMRGMGGPNADAAFDESNVPQDEHHESSSSLSR